MTSFKLAMIFIIYNSGMFIVQTSNNCAVSGKVTATPAFLKEVRQAPCFFHCFSLYLNYLQPCFKKIMFNRLHYKINYNEAVGKGRLYRECVR